MISKIGITILIKTFFFIQLHLLFEKFIYSYKLNNKKKLKKYKISNSNK